MATLYVVATPIGNLDDLSVRATATLKAVDGVVCEDTRVTAKLLAHVGVKKSLYAWHQRSPQAVAEKVVRLLGEGQNLALVSDAGTPGINDPGGILVEAALKQGHAVVPIPGANAAIAALSVSGFPAEQFRYLGFAPHKKGRTTFFHDLITVPEAIVFYEAKFRIVKALTQMRDEFAKAGQADRPIMVARELTKMYETLVRGTAEEALKQVSEGQVLGEFVVVISPWKV
jgi:16S rRNA (cytidine1402-2'-O)-methyltransferase